jgi:hypothetical protein
MVEYKHSGGTHGRCGYTWALWVHKQGTCTHAYTVRKFTYTVYAQSVRTRYTCTYVRTYTCTRCACVLSQLHVYGRTSEMSVGGAVERRTHKLTRPRSLYLALWVCVGAVKATASFHPPKVSGPIQRRQPASRPPATDIVTHNAARHTCTLTRRLVCWYHRNV